VTILSPASRRRWTAARRRHWLNLGGDYVDEWYVIDFSSRVMPPPAPLQTTQYELLYRVAQKNLPQLNFASLFKRLDNRIYIKCSDVAEMSRKPLRHVEGIPNVNKFWANSANSYAADRVKQFASVSQTSKTLHCCNSFTSNMAALTAVVRMTSLSPYVYPNFD